MDFGTMMKLEQHGVDTWVGAGPRYPWGGLYGGQIVAQALRAAALTVEPRFRPHSLHAYFIRGGDHDQPVRFEVDRVRDGRSFATRAVTARQSVGAIFNMSASFQVDSTDGPVQAGPDGQPQIEVQTARMPDFPLPDASAFNGWSPIFDRRLDTRPAQGEMTGWLRMQEPVDPSGEDRVLHACALAYMSDDLPTDAVASLHPERLTDQQFHERYFSASLDHAIWFHQPFDAGRWHVEHFVCHGMLDSRGFTLGYVFTPEGTHVATVSQEVLFRDRR
jgi:acyl-CoA thioesterase-2